MRLLLAWMWAVHRHHAQTLTPPEQGWYKSAVTHVWPSSAETSTLCIDRPPPESAYPLTVHIPGLQANPSAGSQT